MKKLFCYLTLIVLIFSLSSGVFAREYKLGLKEEKADRLKCSARIGTVKAPSKIILSTSVDLTSKMPPVGDQGNQGSCVAWAIGYSLKSMQEGIDQGWTLNTSSHLFSSAYIYNQINNGADNGSYISDGLNLVVNQGCSTLSKTPYNQNDYWTQPSAAARNQASHYKALMWYYTTNFGDVDTVKWWLDTQRTPVVTGIAVGTDFFQLNSTTNKVYDVFDMNYGGHAISLIGYDDNYPVKVKTTITPRKSKYDKYVKPISKIVGTQWYTTVKLGGKTVKKGQTLTTNSGSYYIKVREDDGKIGKKDKCDDIKIVKGTLKYGVNKIAVKVTENAGKYKGKSVTWYFYITRTNTKTTTTVLEKGAFKIQNSWGKEWGQSGFGWISYKLVADSIFNSARPVYGYMLEDIEEDYDE